ncbi:adenylate/guanylate cyclase domain-containing protein [bacterium]|nr:adenylate/guanylate cyclase domain-containing protein [bacterium]
MKNKKNFYAIGFVIGFCVFVLVALAKFFQPDFLSVLELKMLDSFFNYRGIEEPGGQVVIVAVDEKSILQKGRWPWSRTKIARLIDTLTESGCRTIALDIVFSEKERVVPEWADRKIAYFTKTGNQEKARLLNEIFRADDVNANTVLAKSIKESGRTVLGFFVYTSKEELQASTLSGKNKSDDLINRHRIINVYDDDLLPQDIVFSSLGINSNLKQITQSALSSGYFNIIPDTDGVIRRIPLICRYKSNFYPSLSLACVSAYLGKPIKVIFDEAGVESITLSDIINPPIDLNGSMMVNYCGPAQTIKYVSAADVLDKTLDPQLFKDKIALVGITAAGVYDIRVTPFDPVYPGVEIHANAIDNMLNSRYIYKYWWTGLAVYLSLFILFISVTALVSRLRALGGSFACFILMILTAGTSFTLFKYFNVWFSPMYPLMLIAVTYVFITVFKFVIEEKERRFIKGAFSQYLSPQFVDQLVDKPELLKLGGDEQLLTVLFSDIVGFTSISEKLSPSDLVELLNVYTTQMSDIIMQCAGTIDKYNGDAIMAFFGAPIYYVDHPQAACRAALKMTKRLHMLNQEWKKQGKPMFKTRIGINTGKMVVGNMGSRNKFNYTVIGDEVNLASRLEGANKFYKTKIMIGEGTQKRLDASIKTRELDRIKVVGKKMPVRVFEVIPAISFHYRQFLKNYNFGLKHFRQGNYKKALGCFITASRIRRFDEPTKIYIARCKKFIKNPPKDRDWSYELTGK